MDNNNNKIENNIINIINHKNIKKFDFIDNNFNFNQIKKMVPIKINDDFIIENYDNNNNKINYLKKKRKFISIGKHNKNINNVKIEKNNEKNIKINIEIIQLKNNLDNQIKINNIYSYLEKDFFDDSLKEFSYYISNEKMNLYDKIKQKNEIFNENIELNFGQNPIKLYKESLYNNNINENNKDYLKIQQFISISPVLINNNFDYMNELNYSDNIIKMNINNNNYNYIINKSFNKNKKINNNNILKKQIKNNKNYNGEKIYYCNFCNLKFINPQSLGGHMSRLHKYKSEKFLKKKETRNRREPLRNLLYLSKKILFENFYEFRENIDYETFKKTKQFKKIIKELILKYKKEYKQIKNELFQQIKQ